MILICNTKFIIPPIEITFSKLKMIKWVKIFFQKNKYFKILLFSPKIILRFFRKWIAIKQKAIICM